MFEFDPYSYGTYGQKRKVNFTENNAKKHHGKGLGSIVNKIEGSQECIFTARDLLIKAAHQAESRAQQTKILDLLNIFREFLEKDGNIPRDASVLTAQLQRLEQTAQVLQSSAKQTFIFRQRGHNSLVRVDHAPPFCVGICERIRHGWPLQWSC